MPIQIQRITVINDSQELTLVGQATFSATSALKVPAGTTGQRPTGAQGQVRFNTDTSTFEGHNGSSWAAVALTTDSAAQSLAVVVYNSGFCIFAGPLTGGPYNQVAYRYSLGIDCVSSATALGTQQEAGAGVGTTTTGYVGGGREGGINGSVISSVNKYAYATDALSSGTALNTGTVYPAAAGNSTIGVFGGGSPTTGPPMGYTDSAVTSIYTYSGDTVGAGNSLGTARYALAAAGNTTTGIFAGGLTSGGGVSVTDKYTYSSGTVSSGTSLTTAVAFVGAAGNQQIGIFAVYGNPTGTTYKYNYSSDAVSSATALTTAVGDGLGVYAAGNANLGAFVYGYATILDRYTYVGDTVAAGTALSASMYGHPGICNTPGSYALP